MSGVQHQRSPRLLERSRRVKESTTTITTTTATPYVDPNCMDSPRLASKCAGWREQGYCAETSTFLGFMGANCPLTCESCTPAEQTTTTTAVQGTGDACKSVSPHCQLCHLVDDICLVCKNGWSLLLGQCVEHCPGTFPPAQHEVGAIAGYSSYATKGSGSFGLTCVASRNACGIDSCYSCVVGQEEITLTSAGTISKASAEHASLVNSLHFAVGDQSPVCTKCKNSAHLIGGRCVESCPPWYTPNGAGNFGRTCLSPCDWNRQCHSTSCTPFTTTASRADIWTGVASPLILEACTMCRNAQYLLNGNECVSVCPEGRTARGKGNFNRVCE
jgi:hypothetical protein